MGGGGRAHRPGNLLVSIRWRSPSRNSIWSGWQENGSRSSEAGRDTCLAEPRPPVVMGAKNRSGQQEPLDGGPVKRAELWAHLQSLGGGGGAKQIQRETEAEVHSKNRREDGVREAVGDSEPCLLVGQGHEDPGCLWQGGLGTSKSQASGRARTGRSSRGLPLHLLPSPPLTIPARKENVTAQPWLCPLGSSRKTRCLNQVHSVQQTFIKHVLHANPWGYRQDAPRELSRFTSEVTYMQLPVTQRKTLTERDQAPRDRGPCLWEGLSGEFASK